ncbi:transcriptional regulator, GntR family [Paenibacillus curdlanolyticus YK9]|uniref:Transcriptional regulator, GntR family n=1 Tax=Paenibacillus curdlanolyticus YK9 TaxID=717606 RepID=E0I6N4_9BACL|nr:GntR family transcriptional regulator [Paenibacillus curdlanolyticus]EFM11700.1 transcriptional regulator, GntR family [Paenibacillus curdlanolyticus YK9]
MDFTLKPIQPVSTRDAVYDALRALILQLELPPGTAISEKDISLKFNVSRTPVRESFVRLAQEGLLEVYPQRGSYVSLIDMNLVEEARFMREQLEVAVVRLACAEFPAERLTELERNLSQQRASIEAHDYRLMFELDEAFHRTIFEGCNKTNTWQVLGSINAHLNRSRMLRLAADQQWDHLFEQHLGIVEAIRIHDEQHAAELMTAHMHLTIEDQSLLRAKYPDYFKS